jgi:hypothetical protein
VTFGFDQECKGSSKWPEKMTLAPSAAVFTLPKLKKCGQVNALSGENLPGVPIK